MLKSILRALMPTSCTTKPTLAVVVGTTGVGKSQFAIELARRCNGEIINADSMQMYVGVPTITNKHPMNERSGVPHHVMNHVPWNEEYFIHRFAKEAGAAIDDILSREKLPIVVGGTHYYLNSLLFNNKTIGNDQNRDRDEKLTSEQQDILDGPSDTLFEALKARDPLIAEKFHPNDTRRIRRALEIIFLTNTKTSEHYASQKQQTESALKFNLLPFWVYSDKSILDKRLDDRVDKMLAQEGMNEIKELYEFFCKSTPKPDCERGVWQVIGFKEFLPWLESGSTDDELLKRSIEDMKTRTRQYAKRQIKWIKGSLAEDLAKEKKFDFINGGKLFVLDATDLTQWDANVHQRGVEIANAFLNNHSPSSPQVPDSLPADLIPNPEATSEENQSQWKHITCEICRDSEDTPLVLVGSKQYEIHLKSKRHRSNLQRGKRKREYEEWLAKNKETEL